MKNLTLALLAAAAVGAMSIVSVSAMPINSTSPALIQSDVENVRVVCNRNGNCYNTRRYRTARRYYAPGPGYYNGGYYNGGYYNGGYYNGSGYGYYGGPRVGIGIGPFGFGIF